MSRIPLSPRGHGSAVEVVVSVVIPALDAQGHLGHLLPSLLRQTFDRPWEIIVVDNGSTDNTAETARNLLNSNVPSKLVRGDVVSLPSPRGYASPRNFGVRSSMAPLLVFVDADGVVDDHWLDKMVQALEKHPFVGSHIFECPDVSDRSAEAVWLDRSELGTVGGIHYAVTAGLGCTRELFDALGGFDEDFNRGGEDVDFSLRAFFQLGVQPTMELGAIYWTKVPRALSKAFSKGFRDGRTQVRLGRHHRDNLTDSQPQQSADQHRLQRVMTRLWNLRTRDRRQMLVVARMAGRVAGRTIDSTRLHFGKL